MQELGDFRYSELVAEVKELHLGLKRVPLTECASRVLCRSFYRQDRRQPGTKGIVSCLRLSDIQIPVFAGKVDA
jgi:hypothetical protein